MAGVARAVGEMGGGDARSCHSPLAGESKSVLAFRWGGRLSGSSLRLGLFVQVRQIASLWNGPVLSGPHCSSVARGG